MLDLKFSINGDAKFRPFGDLMHLNHVPSTDSNGDLINTKLTLCVDKGDLSNEYKGIQLKLVSECEWQMSRDLLYRDPISSTSPLDDITWQRECPQISWDETTMNTYLYYVASEATSDVLDLKVLNPNPLNIKIYKINNTFVSSFFSLRIMIEHIFNNLFFKLFVIFPRYKIENLLFSSYSFPHTIGKAEF